MSTDPFASWRYKIGIRGRALPELAKMVIYAVCMAAYIWLAAYILHLWPWAREWHWWYIPQVSCLFMVGCIWHYIIFSEVLGL